MAVARLLAEGAADCFPIVHPGTSGGAAPDPAPAPTVPVQWLAAAALLVGSTSVPLLLTQTDFS